MQVGLHCVFDYFDYFLVLKDFSPRSDNAKLYAHDIYLRLK